MFVFVGFICTDCLEFCEPSFSNFFLRLTFLVSCPWFYCFSHSPFFFVARCRCSLLHFLIFCPTFCDFDNPWTTICHFSFLIPRIFVDNNCLRSLLLPNYGFNILLLPLFPMPCVSPPHPPPLWSVSSEVRRRRPLLKWKRGSRVDSVTFGTLSWKSRAKQRGKENEMTGLTSLYVT